MPTIMAIRNNALLAAVFGDDTEKGPYIKRSAFAFGSIFNEGDAYHPRFS